MLYELDLKICDSDVNENLTSKYNFALSQVFRDYSILVTSYIVSKVSLKWIGTRDFRLKIIENERFSVVCSRCRQNLKFDDFTSSLCRWPHKHLLKSVLHVQHDYLRSLNQWNHCFVVLLLPSPSSFLKLPHKEFKKWRRQLQRQRLKSWFDWLSENK